MKIGSLAAFAAWGVVLSGCGTITIPGSNSAPHVDMTQPHDQLYPMSAQAKGEQGTVLVEVYVAPNGRVAKYNISQSSGFGDLDNAALESVLNWRFVPAIQEGNPVSDWTVVKVVYQLAQVTAQSTSPPG